MLFESQEAQGALIKLMLLARYADNRLSIVENKTFERIVRQLEWKGVLSEYSFKNKAIAEVRDAYQSEASEDAFVAEQCALITDEAEVQIAIKKIESVLMADGMTPEESVMFGKIKQRFGY